MVKATYRQCNACGEQEAIRKLYRKNHFTVVRCDTCSLVYTNELPGRAELDEIYTATFFRSSTKFSGSHRNATSYNARQRVADILALPDISTGKWLDIGCATGEFMLAARAAVQEVHGNDISEYAVQRAESNGLSNLMAGDFMEIPLQPNTYDAATMWDVIEHVRDPVANLEKVIQILKPGGYLILSTGDIESKAARLMGRFWHLMIPPWHFYFFSPQTIERMLSRAGFESISVGYPGKRVPLDFMVYKTLYLVHPKLGRFAARLMRGRLGKIAPVVNFYDIMTVTARKPFK